MNIIAAVIALSICTVRIESREEKLYDYDILDEPVSPIDRGENLFLNFK